MRTVRRLQLSDSTTAGKHRLDGQSLVTTLPVASTATQTRVLVHDTETRSPVSASIRRGAAQVVPLKVTTSPWLSTAAQNVAVGQETEVSSAAGSI